MLAAYMYIDGLLYYELLLTADDRTRVMLVNFIGAPARATFAVKQRRKINVEVIVE